METTSAGATIPKINCKQDLAVIKFIEIKPLVLTRSTESGNKICRKTTSAPSGAKKPGRESFSEIKPLVVTHAQQSQVTKIGRKNNFRSGTTKHIYLEQKPVGFAKNNNESISQTIAQT